jgi:putative transposase
MGSPLAPYEARAVWQAVGRQTSAGEATVKQLCKVFGMHRSTWYAAQQPQAAAATMPATGREAESTDGATTTGTPAEQAGGAAPTPSPASETAETVPRKVERRELLAMLREMASAHPAWGYRKFWATLRRQGIRVAQRRVYALCKHYGLLLSPDRTRRQPTTRGHVTVPKSNRRWATDLTTVWTRKDGLCAVMVVVDCGDRSVLGLRASKSQQSLAVLSPVRLALEQSFGSPSLVPEHLELRTDHGPQYTGGVCEAMCRHWRVTHTLAPVGRPTGNAVAERTIRTMKEECIWLEDFEDLASLQAALTAWQRSFNEQRPHQALGWQAPSERRAANLGDSAAPGFDQGPDQKAGSGASQSPQLDDAAGRRCSQALAA